MAKAFKSARRGEPTLKDQIAESGETERSAEELALSEDQVDRRFLGREFLTWLVYRADEDNGGGEFPEEGEVDGFRCVVGERIALKAMGEGTGEIMAKGAAPAATPDVRYAIAGGLTVREADLLFTRGEKIWQAGVSADLFDLKRVKLPALLSEEDRDRALERLTLLDELDGMLKVAYRAFLRERLQRSWDADVVPKMRSWLARSILEERQLEVLIASDEEAAAPKARASKPWKRTTGTPLN